MGVSFVGDPPPPFSWDLPFGSPCWLNKRGTPEISAEGVVVLLLVLRVQFLISVRRPNAEGILVIDDAIHLRKRRPTGQLLVYMGSTHGLNNFFRFPSKGSHALIV